LINGPKSDGKAKEAKDRTILQETKEVLMEILMQIATMDQAELVTEWLGLNGRSISSRKEVQKCNEFGTVVVQITVNRSGKCNCC
jgi:hypothetical protein